MSENRRIARAAGTIAALTLCSRVAGLLRDATIGYLFGTGTAADAFFVAFRFPNLLRRFVAEGAAGAAFVPEFSRHLTLGGRQQAVEALRVLVAVAAVFLLGLTAAGIVFAPHWVAVFAPGFGLYPGKLELTIAVARLLFGYVFLIGLTALLGGFLNATYHFAAPAAAPILLNAAIITFALLLGPHLAQPVYALGIGVMVGGIGQVGLQFWALAKSGFLPLPPAWRPRHEAVVRVRRLMFPVLIGAAVYQLNVAMGTIFASVLPEGSVSYLWYADRVFQFPLGIVAVALGTAALPSFSSQAVLQETAALRASLAFAVRITSFLAIPAAVGLELLALPMVTVLFRRGAFGPHEAEMTAWALRALASGLWSVSVARVLVAAFHALGDTRTPAVAGGVALAANLVLSLAFMGAPAVAGDSALVGAIAAASGYVGVWDLRHAGLALATAGAATLNLALLAVVLSRRLRGFLTADLLRSLARAGAASLAMILPVRWVAGLTDWHAGDALAVHLLVLALAIGAGLLTFGIAAWLLGSQELRSVQELLRRRAHVSGEGAGE